MIIEYRNTDDRIHDIAKTAEALDRARKTERRLVKAGKIKSRRLDPRTIVITNQQTFQRFKNNDTTDNDQPIQFDND